MDVCTTPTETEVHDIKLSKNDTGLGITVAGYVCHEEDISGIFVKEICKGSAADITGNIRINDRIVKVNGVSVTTLTNCQAIEILKNSGPTVVISIERYLKNRKREKLQQSTSVLQLCVSPSSDIFEGRDHEENMCLKTLPEVLEQKDTFVLESSQISAKESVVVERLKIAPMPTSDESDFELSYKSVSNEDFKVDLEKQKTELVVKKKQEGTPSKNDNSSLQSESSCAYYSKISDDTEKDGYETCIDESLSDDVCAKNRKTRIGSLCDNLSCSLNDNACDDVNSNDEHYHYPFLEVKMSGTFSEPCLNNDNLVLTEWNANMNGNLKSYDSAETDEFFLVQCLDEDVSDLEVKCLSETYATIHREKRTYRCLRLREYYNDYENCVEDYRCYLRENPIEKMNIEQNQAQIEIKNVPNDKDEGKSTDERRNHLFKSNSAPDIRQYICEMDSCPIIIKDDRRYSYLPRSESTWTSRTEDMTVTSKQQCLRAEGNSLSQTMLESNWGSRKTVQVCRDSQENLGISIVCGKVDLYNSNVSLGITSGIFVKSVAPNSVAECTGQFHVGDRILEVNGVDLSSASHERAVEVVRNAKSPISFIVQSLVSLVADVNDDTHADVPPSEPSYQTETTVEKQISPPKTPPTIANNVEVEEMIVTEPNWVEEVQDQITDEPKEEVVSDSEEEDEYGYTLDKIRKKYANLGNAIMMVQLERGQQGLGLSLAGHKDRNCMAVFVCGLNPNGVAYKTGGIQVGDEILEVNGVVLHGRCHLNASAIIKGLAGPTFKILILRRKTAIDDIAVRPVTHFPVNFEEQVSVDTFDNYPNVRKVLLQKGSRSLGIMIIEGKHAELGQGIFISDIQYESIAEKAGLEIGEMILAVNRDSLLGANYDIAASILKRTEGVVTLVVSNPIKKSASPVPENVGKDDKIPLITKTSGPSSRAPTPVPEPVVVDPTTCSIPSGKNTAVEIITDNRGLGLFFVGGKDTAISTGIVVLEVFPGGAAHKDGRLKMGDQILEANGTCLKDASAETALQTLRQTLPKMKLTVFRPEKVEYETIEVDLMKKPGKGLGLSIVGRCCGKGVYVSEILNGGNADTDGRIVRGDLLVSVNGQNIQEGTSDEIGSILKTVTGKVVFKFHRFRPALR